MLHTKYQGSRASGFKQEDFLCFEYVSQWKLFGLHDDEILTTEPQFESTW